VVNPASFIRTRCSAHNRPPFVAYNSINLTKHVTHTIINLSPDTVLDTFVFKRDID